MRLNTLRTHSTSAMNSHVPQTRKRARGQPKWWNEDFHEMRREVQKLRRRTWKARADTPTRDEGLCTKNASERYASAERKAKARSWKGFIESYTALNASGMPYKILSGKIKTKSALSTLQTNPHDFTAGTQQNFWCLLSSSLLSVSYRRRRWLIDALRKHSLLVRKVMLRGRSS